MHQYIKSVIESNYKRHPTCKGPKSILKGKRKEKVRKVLNLIYSACLLPKSRFQVHLSLSMLAEYVGSDKSRVHRIIKELLAQGHIKIEDEPNDRSKKDRCKSSRWGRATVYSCPAAGSPTKWKRDQQKELQDLHELVGCNLNSAGSIYSTPEYLAEVRSRMKIKSGALQRQRMLTKDIQRPEPYPPKILRLSA